MPFKVGDVVEVLVHNTVNGRCGRIRQVMPRVMSVPDFQEYVVEFASFHSDRFQFGLCREFELQLHKAVDTPVKERLDS